MTTITPMTNGSGKIRLPVFQWATTTVLFIFWTALTFSLALAQVAFFFALGCWTCRKFQSRTSVLLSSLPAKLWIPLAIYLSLCVLSIFWSEYPALSLKGMWKTLQHFFIFIMVIDTFSVPPMIHKFEHVFIVTSFVLVANSFCQYFIGHDLIRGYQLLQSSAGPRLSASFKTYGLYGSYLILTIPYLLMLGLRYRNFQHKWWHWYLCFVTFIGSVLALFLTRSRGAILSLILGSSFFLMQQKKIRSFLLLLALFLGISMIVPRSMIIHLDIMSKEQSLTERYHLWSRAIQVIEAKPLTGTGINTYTAAHPKYDKIKNWRVKTYYAHNGYLQLAAEIGLPGLAAFCLFLIQYFWYFFKSLKDFKNGFERGVMIGLLAGILNFLIFAATDTILHNPQAILPFWFFLALPVVYKNRLQYS